MDFGESGIGVCKLQLDRARGLAPAAADFRECVFETVDHIDAYAVLRSGHWIEDRLTTAFGHAGSTRRALRAAMSSWNSIGAKIGSCTFSKVDANTLKTVVPGSVSWPLRMRSSEPRCASFARSSITTAASPLPS